MHCGMDFLVQFPHFRGSCTTVTYQCEVAAQLRSCTTFHNEIVEVLPHTVNYKEWTTYIRKALI